MLNVAVFVMVLRRMKALCLHKSTSLQVALESLEFNSGPCSVLILCRIIFVNVQTDTL